MKQQPDIEKLFTEFYEKLHRYAFTIVSDSEDAADVIQAVFTRLWEKRNDINIRENPKAYLYRIVHNECIDHIRKRDMKNKHYTALQKQTASEEPRYFSAEEQKETEERINTILNMLPPQCRLVFIKCRSEQKKHAEIAAELNISVKTVQAHMVKALKLIRAAVGVNTLLIGLIYITRIILKHV